MLNEHGIQIRCAPKAGSVAKLLLITPKKVGSAPKRNLIRRRLKAIFFEEQLYTGNYSYVIFVEKAAVALPFATLKELMLQAQERAKNRYESR